MESSFLGGGVDYRRGLAVDSFSRAYVTGSTTSADLREATGANQSNALQPTLPRARGSAFLAQVRFDATPLGFVTYLDGTAPADGLAAGSAVAVGRDDSPVTVAGGEGGPADVAPVNGFVTQLTADGTSLVYSTPLAGGVAAAVAVDSRGFATVTGRATANFAPAGVGLQDAYGGGGHDAFVTLLDVSGGTSYASFLGGSGDDQGTAVALDTLDSAYIVGYTSSPDFPGADGGPQPYAGGYDAFAVAVPGFALAVDDDYSVLHGRTLSVDAAAGVLANDYYPPVAPPGGGVADGAGARRPGAARRRLLRLRAHAGHGLRRPGRLHLHAARRRPDRRGGGQPGRAGPAADRPGRPLRGPRRAAVRGGRPRPGPVRHGPRHR
jgi:hypothetical protein